MLAVETKRSPEQLGKKTERDKPDRATEHEHQPQRHFRKEQRRGRANQRALGETEVIINQQMNMRELHWRCYMGSDGRSMGCFVGVVAQQHQLHSAYIEADRVQMGTRSDAEVQVVSDGQCSKVVGAGGAAVDPVGDDEGDAGEKSTRQ